ncbi:MAG: Uncharacterized protein G01um101431_337 [Parcubacteria group bacterium Gr01-1014_31]|nr:MAG: Uncharacterized protein G01um101431_337 [Parcubacteria group bacterium Gr01-1014_31]
MATRSPAEPIGIPALRTSQRRFFWTAVGLNALVWLYVLLRVRPHAEPIILHYTLYFGIDRVGEWYRAYLLPLAGSIVIALNHGVGTLYRSREPLVGTLLMGVAIVVQGILFLAAATVLR